MSQSMTKAGTLREWFPWGGQSRCVAVFLFSTESCRWQRDKKHRTHTFAGHACKRLSMRRRAFCMNGAPFGIHAQCCSRTHVSTPAAATATAPHKSRPNSITRKGIWLCSSFIFVFWHAQPGALLGLRLLHGSFGNQIYSSKIWFWRR